MAFWMINFNFFFWEPQTDGVLESPRLLHAKLLRALLGLCVALLGTQFTKLQFVSSALTKFRFKLRCSNSKMEFRLTNTLLSTVRNKFVSNGVLRVPMTSYRTVWDAVKRFDQLRPTLRISCIAMQPNTLAMQMVVFERTISLALVEHLSYTLL